MKYVLIIWICSFMNGQNCGDGLEYPTLYTSWYECTRDAQVQSMKILSKAGYKYVNDHKLATKYNCLPVRTY